MVVSSSCLSYMVFLGDGWIDRHLFGGNCPRKIGLGLSELLLASMGVIWTGPSCSKSGDEVQGGNAGLLNRLVVEHTISFEVSSWRCDCDALRLVLVFVHPLQETSALGIEPAALQGQAMITQSTNKIQIVKLLLLLWHWSGSSIRHSFRDTIWHTTGQHVSTRAE